MIDFAAVLCIIKKKGVGKMTQTENTRMAIGLRKKGWTDTEIVDFMIWVESGDSKYEPKDENEK